MAQQHHWFVRIPDQPDVLQTRLDNRPLHLSHNGPHFESGKIFFGGPILSSQPENKDDAPPKIVGSIHAIKASSEEEVWRMLMDDPYARLGVWDLNKAIVTPFRCFVSKEM